MRRLLPTILGALLLGALVGCPRDDGASATSSFDPYATNVAPDPYEDWYPETVDAPEGTEYPVRLLPLAPTMEGLPGGDHAYINHVFSQIVVLARANLRMKNELGKPDQAQAVDLYDGHSTEVLDTIDAEEVPKGLETFHDDLLAAIRLQFKYFEAAAAVIDKRMEPLFESEASDAVLETARGNALEAAEAVLEGKAASAKLTAAWAKLSKRYTGHWDNSVRDAIYSHLRAMDL